MECGGSPPQFTGRHARRGEACPVVLPPRPAAAQFVARFRVDSDLREWSLIDTAAE